MIIQRIAPRMQALECIGMLIHCLDGIVRSLPIGSGADRHESMFVVGARTVIHATPSSPLRYLIAVVEEPMSEGQENQWFIRQARREDVLAIVQLLANDPLGKTRESVQDPVERSYLEAFDAITKDENQFLAIMERAGAVIGTLQLTFIPGLSRRGSWRMEIEAVRIHEDCRGQGLGEEFIQWAINKAKERNCRLVQLTTDKTRIDAHRFYQKLGFVASHEGMKLSLQ